MATMIFLIAILGALFGLWLWPEDAHAWGPISHMDFAVAALKDTARYLPEIQTLLASHPKDFLYGVLAADITVGKSYVDYIYNCHSWRVGFLLLNEARDERQRATAYGYLVHLASDIIAHNYFVPVKTIRSYPTRTLGHVYWEMRFDAKRPQRIWKLTKEICEGDFSYNDELFQRMLKRTLFSFKTNRRIFSSILNLHKLERWQQGMKHLDRRSQWTLSTRTAKEYRDLAVQSVRAFLTDPQSAPCTKVDPTGADKLLYAKEIRRQLKKALRRGAITRDEGDDFVQRAKAALKKGIYAEVDLPEVADLFV